MLSIKIGKAMQEVMTVQAERIARETKCSRRSSILGGAGLVQTLVFAYLRNRLATCEELAQTAATLGYAVSSSDRRTLYAANRRMFAAIG